MAVFYFQELIKLIKIKETEEIIGDVNLFFNDDKIAEINIMIADSKFRGRGYAAEVLNALIPYSTNVFLKYFYSF